MRQPFEVVVIGGGNAGINAAISARRAGARVLLVEKADVRSRGGNTRHTRDIRHPHPAPTVGAVGRYAEDEFLHDIEAISDGSHDLELTEILVGEARAIPGWMEEHGVKWQPELRGALHLSRTNSFFLGGGKALLNTYYEAAEALGVEIAYATSLSAFEVRGSTCEAVHLMGESEHAGRVEVGAVVAAAGGFEANLGWLRRYWGDAVNNYIVRGTPNNDGHVLGLLLDLDAAQVGDPQSFHAVAVDARSPRFDGGIVTRVDAAPYGIVVNSKGERFYDEGEELWPKRYAIWGGLIARQPDQRAFAIFDREVRNLFIPSIYPPIEGDTIEELASWLDLDPAALSRTIGTYNDHLDRHGTFRPGELDGLATHDLSPPKSNWARPIGLPLAAYPLRPGITFTYMGVKVDSRCRVVTVDGLPLDNVFAAGEIMAGNILTRGYLAGIGLTIGTVFGVRAGREAAANVA
jgi:tricarballylate dehydrogenase